jgi:hydroxymethylbilane synthase
MTRLIIGTRGSALALAQVKIVRGLLANAHPALSFETKIIKTSGDRFVEMSLSAGAGKGLFTKEIEEQLLAGNIDIAIHSLKDLPTELPAGLMIGAVPVRADVRDVFLSRQYASLDELPAGARVATSSIRRRAQLLAQRPDLRIDEIRGNVETRLRKLAETDQLDGLVLAAAGLKRLGLWEKLSVRARILEVEEMIPRLQGQVADIPEVGQHGGDAEGAVQGIPLVVEPVGTALLAVQEHDKVVHHQAGLLERLGRLELAGPVRYHVVNQGDHISRRERPLDRPADAVRLDLLPDVEHGQVARQGDGGGDGEAGVGDAGDPVKAERSKDIEDPKCHALEDARI